MGPSKRSMTEESNCSSKRRKRQQELRLLSFEQNELESVERNQEEINDLVSFAQQQKIKMLMSGKNKTTFRAVNDVLKCFLKNKQEGEKKHRVSGRLENCVFCGLRFQSHMLDHYLSVHKEQFGKPGPERTRNAREMRDRMT